MKDVFRALHARPQGGRRRVLPPFLMTVVLTALVGPGLAEAAAPKTFEPHELVVRFTSKTTTSSQRSVLSNVGGKVDEKLPIKNLRLIRLPKHGSVLKAAKALRHRKGVLYAEPNFIYHTTNTPSDPLFPQLWGLEKIKAPAAWDITTG